MRRPQADRTMKLPGGYVLLEARLTEPVKGPAALAGSLSDAPPGVASDPIFLGAARAGRNLARGRAFRVMEVPGQTVEMRLFTAGGASEATVNLSATKTGMRRALWHAVRYFPFALARCVALALVGQRRLARLKLAYTLQGRARPISYST